MAEPFEINEEVVLPADPDAVWAAISTEGGLAAWLMPMPMGGDSPMVRTWEPGRRLVVETPPDEAGATQTFEYLIEGRGDGTTVLRFAHSGFLADDWDDEHEPMTRAGWQQYLATLAAYLEHFPGRPATYVEAEAPATTVVDVAWPELRDRLALGDDPLGAAVAVDLGRAGTLEGVVDLVMPDFVGVRTADALVRFHGRRRIGLPIAVSHHAYGPVDAAELAQAWTTWFETAGDGVLDTAGDQPVVRFTRRLPQPVEVVWAAITEADHLAAWFPTTIDGERQPGAAVRFEHRGAEHEGFDGRILAWEPPTVFELDWGGDVLRFELAADPAGCTLTLTDTLGEVGKAARDAAGWHECLDQLAEHLAGVAPTFAAGERWAQVHPRYVEAWGPEASSIGPPAAA